MKLGIDCATQGKRTLISRLAKLKTTTEVSDGGEYWMDRKYSQVHIETTWTEDQLDAWLYNTKGLPETYGTFSRESAE